MIKFNKDCTLKTKDYSLNCTVKNENQWRIIAITQDEYIFSTNNIVENAWTLKRDTCLRLKGQEQDIIVPKIIFLFECFNLSSLSLEKRQGIIEKTGFTQRKAAKIFKYKKNNEKYWDEAKLY